MNIGSKKNNDIKMEEKMRVYSHKEFSEFASRCGWCRGYGCFQCSERYEIYLASDEDKSCEDKSCEVEGE